MDASYLDVPRATPWWLPAVMVAAVCAAALGVSVLGDPGCGGPTKRAQREIGYLSGFVEQYAVMNAPNKLPESLGNLADYPSPIIKSVPRDPWGNDYIYNKVGPRGFEITSAGADGQPGTDDDVRGRW